MAEIPPPTNITSFQVTNSPESGLDIPLVISWWTHPTPEHPQVVAYVDVMRRFIREYGMHEHMRHNLADDDGEPTVLELADGALRMLHHPVARQVGDFPVPDPVPDDFGNALVTGGMGAYVLMATPALRQPTFSDLRALAPEDFGMARITTRFDEAAREQFAEHPVDRIERLVNEEEDPALRAGLRMVYGLGPERGWL